MDVAIKHPVLPIPALKKKQKHGKKMRKVRRILLKGCF
jgi:hypothetical protein